MPEEDISPAENEALPSGFGLNANGTYSQIGQQAPAQTLEEFADQQTFNAFGEGWEPATDFDNTNQRIYDTLVLDRPDNPPAPIQEFECRIGGSKFFIPPVSISVNQRFKAGSMTGGAIRQQNSPKFSAGNTETVIQMTLFFPTIESVWGVDDFKFEVDFDNEDIPDERIDHFLSSLRGLMAQFKYAPFLPIKNAYLNQVFGITGVALKDISVSTVMSYPFCMEVNLTLYKFNHRVFLPMIDNFDQAIHWGRFRQYMGRAISRMDHANPINQFTRGVDKIGDPQGDIEPYVQPAEQILANQGYGYGSSTTIFKLNDFTASRFDLFFPFYNPAEVKMPDLSDLRYKPVVQVRAKNWWENLMSTLGFNPDVYAESDFDRLANAKEKGENYTEGYSDTEHLYRYLESTSSTVTEMGPAQLEAYLNQQYQDKGADPNSPEGLEIRLRVRNAWFLEAYRRFTENPTTAALLANEDKRRRQLTIDEWEVPMWKLGGQEGLNPNYVTIHGVSITMGNILSRLQLQMQDEPTHQHIGGEDTRIEVSMLIHGDRSEEYLLKMRNMFDSISGLARLEHSHGVLGFLGIRNAITDLAGVRHVVPLSFNVDTVEDYPHTYHVTLSLVDFDVFQQKREQLSAEQQAEVVDAFGKRNPMLRIKQLWGMFNAYPDFPLAVRDDEGKVVGHLDPDYYFRAFQVIDDDTVEPTNRGEESGRALQPMGIDLPIRSAVDKIQAEQEADSTSVSAESNFIRDPGVHISFGSVDGIPQYVTVDDDGMTFRNGNEVVVNKAPMPDLDAAKSNETAVDGLTPLSGYTEQYAGGGSDPRANFDLMAKDMQYRDKSGRMIRAYPTYMLWLVDEGGNYAAMKLFNNFYGLQSVIDMSIMRSEDVMADTLMLRVSNLYSKLTTEFGGYLDQDEYSGVHAALINERTSRSLRQHTGIGDFLVDLETIRLKPGVRLHLKMGYGSNPNTLETVFNGMISEVQEGDILTIVAQSDAVELGALVNSTNEKGHTGKIDGALSGLYLSEPRDLMISLLTQGSSVVKETIAHATQGEIFSENRYGIKHFGAMIYEPLGAKDAENIGKQKRLLSNRVLGIQDDAANVADVNQNNPGILAGAPPGTTPVAAAGYTSIAIAQILNDAFINLSTKPDYELFKRNIYPGNGVGVAQFMGGDYGDLVLNQAIDGTDSIQRTTGVDADGANVITDPLTGEKINVDTVDQVEGALAAQAESGDVIDYDYDEETNTVTNVKHAPPPNPGLAGLIGGALTHSSRTIGGTFGGSAANLLDKLSINKDRNLDDDGDFDEVAFRAQTYMKTVWDLFKVSAALLPDYIVAIRPFEDRSTIFYGKPHWLYTSGVIPLTTGPYPDGAVATLPPDSSYADIYTRLEQEYARRDEVFKNDLLGAVRSQMGTGDVGGSGGGGVTADPTFGTQGMVWADSPDSILNASFASTTRADGNPLPWTEGPVVLEMHIPTSPDLEEDVVNQAPSNASLPGQYHHPFYMDREDGPRGGYIKEKDKVPYDPSRSPLEYTHLGEDPKTPGEPGNMEYLDPESERWYMCQYWDEGWKENQKWKGERILLYRPDVKKGVVCTPGDEGPKSDVYRAGCSPETYIALGSPDSSVIVHYRVLPRSYPLGPVEFNSSGIPTDPSAPSTEEDEELATVDPDAIPEWAKDYESVDKALAEAYKIIDAPVSYANDPKGMAAKAVYQGNRSDEQANQIWGELKKRFYNDKATRQAYLDNHPEYKEYSAEDLEAIDDLDEQIEEEATRFIRELWDDGVARGWIVFVTSPRTDLIQIPGAVDVDWRDFVPGAGDSYDWNLGEAFRAFGQWTAALDGDPAAALQTHMDNNQRPGGDQSHPVGQLLENTIRQTQDVFDDVKKLFSAVGNIGSGIFNFLKFSLFQMTEGLTQANDMQMKANTLNSIYNDSIYFSAGMEDGVITNHLLYYADNPFTREYGEPVAEIREPFQRMHTIGSFGHIINNGIIESMDDVATTITAVSNGSDPVTVHFDKGMPSERQFEKTIETGLFYDDPGFWGRFNPLNVVQQARETNLKFSGNSPELSAKRIALSHLKEELKNIYQGELTILGDPTIRPYDLVYMADTYERMYGFFEVEQVVHHFTPETGFVTTLTPNACVTVNDPGRFYLMTRHRANKDIQRVRDRIRERYKVRVDTNDIGIVTSATENDETSINDIAADFEDTLRGSVQYHGGSGKIVQSLSSVGIGGGALAAGALGAGAIATAGTGLVGGFLGWKAWEWVRDNLLDQHGCYISYLTKNGESMDANLSYAEGVAVGHQHSMTLILAGLNITEISKTDADGNPKIRTQDVIKSLQWDEQGPNELAKEVNMFVESTLFELRQLSGRYGNLIADTTTEAYLGEVWRIIDGDTFEMNVRKTIKFGQITPSSVSLGPIRVSGSQAPEDPHKGMDIQQALDRYPNHPGVRATEFAHNKLLPDGEGITVAVRVNTVREKSFDRTIAYVFHNVPDGVDHPTDRDAYLLNKAGSIPLVPWDSYTSDGKPMTYDWDLIASGHGELEARDLHYNLPGATSGDIKGENDQQGGRF